MIDMEWSGIYAPEGAEFLYFCTVLMFVMYTTIINKNTNTKNMNEKQRTELSSLTVDFSVSIVFIV